MPKKKVIKKKKSPKKKVTIGKGKKISREKYNERKKKPGQGNLGRYKNVKPSDFAGPDGTYPINTRQRGISALKLAHNSPHSESIKKKVYAKYPDLKPKSKK